MSYHSICGCICANKNNENNGIIMLDLQIQGHALFLDILMTFHISVCIRAIGKILVYIST